LDADAIDVDAIGNAIGYSLRRMHLAVVVWSPETNRGDELVRMEGFVREVAESVDSQGPPLFVAADKVTGWGWVPLSIEVAQLAVARIRGLAET
ncbi:PucR family transcriptional regulator, partial [Mycobacteroides abscessus subsp. abscessus]